MKLNLSMNHPEVSSDKTLELNSEHRPVVESFLRSKKIEFSFQADGSNGKIKLHIDGISPKEAFRLGAKLQFLINEGRQLT